MAAKADVNAGSVPALYYATVTGNPEMVSAVLAARPALDWQDPTFGTTALMLALAPYRFYVLSQPASSAHWDIARLLVQAGANVNVVTRNGVTALKLVAEEGSPGSLAMVQALLAANADVNGGWVGRGTLGPASPDYTRAAGYTALGLAASTGSAEVVQALLAANSWVDVNARQHDGNTPLTVASAKGRADIVRLLLAAKADAGSTDNDGKTALMLALENDHAEVANLLRSGAR